MYAHVLTLLVASTLVASLALPSPRTADIPVMCTGRVVVSFLDTTTSYWLLQYPNNNTGLYGNLTTLPAHGLAATIPCITSEPTNLVALNGPNATLPNVGFIQAPGNPADIGVGSDSYGTIGPTSTSPNGSLPFPGENGFTNAEGETELIESAVWMYDPYGHSLSASWKNSNGTTSPAQLFWNADRNWLGFTGDFGALNGTFGATNHLVPVGLALDMTPQALVDLPLLDGVLKK